MSFQDEVAVKVPNMRSRNAVTETLPPGPPPRVGRRLLAFAALAAFVGAAGAQAQQKEDQEQAVRRARAFALALQEEAARRAALAERFVWFEAQFDRQVFQQYGNAAGARRRLDEQLAVHIQDLDQVCRLTDAQKQKLRLAGRGDITRFFDRYEDARQRFSGNQDEQKLPVLFRDLRSLQGTLQATLQDGLFHEDSLLYKALPNTLTTEQFARYDAKARERRASQHRANIELALQTLERSVSLGEVRRRELLTLMAKEIKPPRRASSYDQYRILIQLGRLPQERLKPLFDDAQWRELNQQLVGFKRMEPQLIQVGMLPVEDDADRTDEPPAAVKR
jgi:hypothetical protein